MGGLFQIAEVVDVAIDEEHQGVVFYEALERRAQSPAVQEAARRLAEEERGHERAFRSLREHLEAYLAPETYPGEYADYLGALLDGRVFPGEAEAAALARAGTEADALRVAIRFEKNALLLFAEMQRLVPDQARATVELLIDEERGHLVDLNRLLGQIGAP